MGKYNTSLPGQRDPLFSPGEHFFLVTECGVFPSADPRKKGTSNYRLGGRIVQSKGSICRLTYADGKVEDKSYPPLPMGLKVVDFGSSADPDFGPQALGKFTRVIMDSLHLTASGAPSPLRTKLLEMLGSTFSQQHITEATKRHGKMSLRDDWNEDATAEENAKAWVDVEKFFAGGQGKGLIVCCEAKATITKSNQREITKTYFRGVDQAEWYTLSADGDIVPKYDIGQ